MKPEPVFEEPWHAHVFAVTVSLNEAGHFDWTDWADKFGATLAQHGLTRSLNGGSDYFTAWLETLEHVLTDRGLADAATLATLKADWAHAYETTPHGQPVLLG